MELRKSPVKFLEDGHEYWLGFKQLSGVTTMLKAMLPEQYANIPEDVLRRAAAYGTSIHNAIERCLEEGTTSEAKPVCAALSMIENNGLEHIASEYLVSDETAVASQIDFVGRRKRTRNKVVLGDYKTTSTYHKESVTYQLNVYKVLFEDMNPEIKVEKLVCFWLPKEQYGEPQYIDVDILPEAVIRDMIRCYQFGYDWESYIPIDAQVVSTSSLPAEVINAEGTIFSLLQKKKELEEQVAKIKEYEDMLREAMEKHNVKQWDADSFKATRVDATTRKSFDKDKARDEDPEGYKSYVEFTQKYQKETAVKGSIKFTLKTI